MTFNAMHAAIEAIEADAMYDMYAAAPASYARQNGLRYRRFGNAVGLSHANLVSPVFARVVGASALEELASAVAWMDEEGVPGWFAQLPSTDETEGVQKDLENQGFKARGTGWAKFRSASPPAEVKRDPQISVRQVFEPDSARFGDIVQTAFGLPPTSAEWFAELPGRPRWHTFLAFWQEEPVACGSMYVKGDRAWMGIGATRAEFRGRGAQSLLLREPLAHSRSLGVTTVTVEAEQPAAGREKEYKSYANCRKAGFAPVYVRLNLTRASS